jgi:hypothetical protein
MFERFKYNAYLGRVNIAYRKCGYGGFKPLSMEVIDLGRKEEYNLFSYAAFKNGMDETRVAIIAGIALNEGDTFLSVIETLNHSHNE